MMATYYRLRNKRKYIYHDGLLKVYDGDKLTKKHIISEGLKEVYDLMELEYPQDAGIFTMEDE